MPVSYTHLDVYKRQERVGDTQRGPTISRVHSGREDRHPTNPVQKRKQDENFYFVPVNIFVNVNKQIFIEKYKSWCEKIHNKGVAIELGLIGINPFKKK